MKKIIGLLIILIATAFSQDSINIHLKTGKVSYPITDVDSITYSIKLITGTMTDQDGNVYQTVKIGDQWWMAENLKVTTYRNGDAITKVTDILAWSGIATEGYCAYNNDEGNVDTYGYLYNWYAVEDSRNIAPEGWHVPSDEEWQTLVDYLGGGAVAGGKLKSTTGWNAPNTGATNESGFSALPGGYRNFGGNFNYMGNYGFFWSATESGSANAWGRYLVSNNASVSRGNNYKQYGLSLRLVRD